MDRTQDGQLCAMRRTHRVLTAKQRPTNSTPHLPASRTATGHRPPDEAIVFPTYAQPPKQDQGHARNAR